VAELKAAQEKEAEAKRLEADAERIAKVNEIAERARLREAELDARQRAEREAAGAAPQPRSGTFVPPALRSAGGGGAPIEGGDRWGGGGGSRPEPAPRADDRWSRPGGGGGSSGGGAPPAAAVPAPRQDAPPQPAPAASGGKFVPSRLRGK
jgi:hypothetical protein